MLVCASKNGSRWSSRIVQTLFGHPPNGTRVHPMAATRENRRQPPRLDCPACPTSYPLTRENELDVEQTGWVSPGRINHRRAEQRKDTGANKIQKPIPTIPTLNIKIDRYSAFGGSDTSDPKPNGKQRKTEIIMLVCASKNGSRWSSRRVQTLFGHPPNGPGVHPMEAARENRRQPPRLDYPAPSTPRSPRKRELGARRITGVGIARKNQSSASRAEQRHGRNGSNSNTSTQTPAALQLSVGATSHDRVQIAKQPK